MRLQSGNAIKSLFVPVYCLARYLLKAYLMFGDEQYLDWFAELYGSTMKYTQLPISFRGYSFLVDVQMDTGRLARHFVSSLGAFWPAMQALIGEPMGIAWEPIMCTGK